MQKLSDGGVKQFVEIHLEQLKGWDSGSLTAESMLWLQKALTPKYFAEYTE